MKIIKQTPKYIGVQGIYAIINIEKTSAFCSFGKPYVGQAMAKPDAKKHKMGIGARLRDHRYKLRRNIHGNQKLQNAWNKYGEDSFVYVCVEEVLNITTLTEREQYWLNKWCACKCGYNVREVADSTRGFHIKPILDKNEIIKWIKDYKKEHGKFPTQRSGKINCKEKLTWSGLSMALSKGFRGLNEDCTLPVFIALEFNVVNGSNKKTLTEDMICGWFEMFYETYGYYPTHLSGIVECAKDFLKENIKWVTISELLKKGQRGLPGGTSLRKLIETRAKNKIKFKHWHRKD